MIALQMFSCNQDSDRPVVILIVLHSLWIRQLLFLNPPKQIQLGPIGAGASGLPVCGDLGRFTLVSPRRHDNALLAGKAPPRLWPIYRVSVNLVRGRAQRMQHSL